MNAIARLLSYLFHPLLMPTYLFAFLAITFPIALEPIQPESHTLFVSLIFIVTCVIPALLIGILKSFGTVSFHMLTRRERVVPFFLITLIYCFITYLFYTKTRISLDDNFMKLMVILDLLAIASTVLTFFFKISVHSLVVWGVIGILIPLNKLIEVNTLFTPMLLFVVLTGFIMSARVQIGAHSLKEVLWGAVAGLATSIGGMYYLFQ